MENIESLTSRLLSLESAVVADVMDTMGLENQILAADLRPVRSGSKMAGPAICAAGTEDHGGRGLPTYGLDDAVYPGGIVVIDSDNCETGALIGDNMVTSMMNRGARGFVVDGGIRDAADFADLSAPVFYRYISSVNAHRYWRFTAFEEAVSLRGIRGTVMVHPGDLLLADQDGIAILPKKYAAQIIADAEIHMCTEAGIKKELLAGGDRKAVTLAAQRLQHVRPL